MGCVTSVTRKGQVTIPKEVRDWIGIRPFDRVEFYVERGETKVRKARRSLDEIAGSVPSLAEPLDDAEMTRIAAEDWVDRYARENR